MQNTNEIKWGTMVPLIGGMTIGNEKATGVKPSFLISYPSFSNNDAHAKNYYKDVPFVTLNETTNDFESNIDEQKIKNLGDIDFISTVCPCAGLSDLNPKSSSDAIQNDWMYKTADFVMNKIKPKVFWGENAPALFTNKGVKVKNKLIEIGKKNGYTFSIIKTDTRLHGIPQRRIRSFYFFWRDSNPPTFEQVKKEYPNVIDYLKEIPSSATLQDVYANNDYETNVFIQWMHKNLNFIEYIKSANEKSNNKIKTLFGYMLSENKYDEFIEYFNSMGLDKYAQKIEYIKTKINNNLNIWDNTPTFLYGLDHSNAIQGRIFVSTLHPTESRYLNVREYMHLMGLPHNFELYSTKNLNHICQNVPVNTAADWTSQIIDYLKGARKIHTDIYFEFNNTAKTEENSQKNTVTETGTVKLF
jgi:site-specific DNA-cytosine methylase